jgi:acyl-CoA synthetase (NDP forming)
MTSRLDPLFAPRSIAVIGASPDLRKAGGRCVAFLRDFGYPGEVYPVNPRRDEIAGYRAYPRIADVPGPVDLAIVVIDAAAVPAVIAEAGAAGVRSAVVCSSGFSELGLAGAELEADLACAAAKYRLPVLGPNSLGFIDLDASLTATFSTALQFDGPLRSGPIALVSQSGAMGAAIFGVAQMEGMAGVGGFVSTGNEAVLGFTEVLGHIGQDGKFSVLLGYIEGLDDGRRLVDDVRAMRAAGKDVVLLKVGRSDAGKVAARSHTGAMAGSDRAWQAALDRAGAIRAESPESLLDIGQALASPRRPAGNRVGVVSMSGGAGVLITDRLAAHGLRVTTLDDASRRRISAALPGLPSVGNPLDFGPVYTDPEAVITAVRCMAETEDVDLVVVFLGLSPNLAGVVEEPLAAIAASCGKPMVLAWLGGPAAGRRRLAALGVPALPDPARAADAAAALVRSASPLPASPVAAAGPAAAALRSRLRALAAAGASQIAEREAKRLLAEYGIPASMDTLATSRDEAERIARAGPGPYAVKAEAPGLLHKSDAGAVLLDVPAADAADAYEEVVAAARRAGASVRGAVLAPMAPPGGVELLIGLRWDEQFGPLVLVGAGGVTSEVARDTAVDLAPVTHERARQMLAGLRIAPMLGEFRGRPALAIDAAADALVRLSELGADAGDALREFDVNPLTVYDPSAGVIALDAAAVLGEMSREK